MLSEFKHPDYNTPDFRRPEYVKVLSMVTLTTISYIRYAVNCEFLSNDRRKKNVFIKWNQICVIKKVFFFMVFFSPPRKARKVEEMDGGSFVWKNVGANFFFFFMDSIIGTIQSSDWMFWKLCNIFFSSFRCRRMQKFDQKSSWVRQLWRWSKSTACGRKNSQPRIVKINWFIELSGKRGQFLLRVYVFRSQILCMQMRNNKRVQRKRK